MAEVLSGSLSTNNEESHGYGTLGLTLSWTATQSIVNNTSTIKWTVKSKGTMSSGYWYYCYGVEVTINGTKVLNTTSKFEMKGDGGYKKTGTITVAHGTDGSKTVAMSVRAKIYDNSWNCTKSGSFTLKKINRYALVSSISDFTNDVANNGYPTLVYTNPAGTALTTGLKARLAWNNEANYTDWVTLNDEGGEYTFTSSTLTSANITSMLNSCPDSNALSLIVDLQSTMNGVEYHDKKAVTMYVEDANPIFSVAPSFQDALPAIAGHSDVIVQKQSKLRIYHGTAQAQKGASLASVPYNLEFCGNVYNFEGAYVEIDKPDMAGTYTATIYATDTRTNTTPYDINITILEWSAPTAECSLERQNSFNTECDLKVDANYSGVNGFNTIVIKEKHRVIGTSAWSTEVNVPDGETVVKSLANTSEWEMEITLSDIFGSVEPIRLTVGKGIPYIYKDYKRNSFAFNSIPDADDQFKIGGQLKCESMYVEDISSQYTITKTSGNWMLDAVTAHRTGNVVELAATFKGNGSAVSAGSNAFVGQCTAGHLPLVAAKGISFISSGGVVFQIDNDGNVYARVIGSSITLASTSTNTIPIVFIIND